MKRFAVIIYKHTHAYDVHLMSLKHFGLTSASTY